MEKFPETLRHNPLTPELRQKILEVDGVDSVIPRTGITAFVSLPNTVSKEDIAKLFENTKFSNFYVRFICRSGG